MASAISLHFGKTSYDLELAKLKSSGPATLERAAPATERPLLAEERGDACYAAPMCASAPLSNEDAMNEGLEPKRLRSTAPSAVEQATPALELPRGCEKTRAMRRLHGEE